MDAGLVRNIKGKCKFIPLRCGLDLDRLPPLLEAKQAPALDRSHDESSIKKLIGFIHGISDKPPLGEPPQAIRESSGGALGLSPAAEAIVKIMIERSENGMAQDPAISPVQLKEAIGLDDDDLIDAVDELETQGYVRPERVLCAAPFGYKFVDATNALFVTFDKPFGQGDPEGDALRIAADLVNGSSSGDVPEMAKKYEWPPRRMNPAISYLVENNLVGARDFSRRPWVRHWLYKTPETHRFVRDRS